MYQTTSHRLFLVHKKCGEMYVSKCNSQRQIQFDYASNRESLPEFCLDHNLGKIKHGTQEEESRAQSQSRGTTYNMRAF